MNSTQYLIILTTAVVCFCIYVLAEILRLRRREDELRTSEPNLWMSWSASDDMTDAASQRLQEEIRDKLNGGDAS